VSRGRKPAAKRANAPRCTRFQISIRRDDENAHVHVWSILICRRVTRHCRNKWVNCRDNWHSIVANHERRVRLLNKLMNTPHYLHFIPTPLSFFQCRMCVCECAPCRATPRFHFDAIIFGTPIPIAAG
jgi:hypothetical protein